MRPPRSLKDLGTWVIGLGCAYEAFSLATRLTPPWTTLTRRLPIRRRAVTVGLFCAWIAVHMGPWRRGVA